MECLPGYQPNTEHHWPSVTVVSSTQIYRPHRHTGNWPLGNWNAEILSAPGARAAGEYCAGIGRLGTGQHSNCVCEHPIQRKSFDF